MVEPELTPEEQIKKNINRAKYGWTRWGGGNRGLVQEDLTEEWNCQTCGEKQTKELPPFMYEYSEREYIRICSKCHNKRLQEHIEPLHFDILIVTIRRSHDLIEYLPE